MNRRRAVLAGGVLLTALAAASAAAQFPGVPAVLAAYRTWTKMNLILMNDPSNPRAGPKNTFISLSPAALREIVGTGARNRRPYPEGTMLVRESLHPTERFVTVLFAMRKDVTSADQRGGWVWSGFSRQRPDQAFAPLPIVPNPELRCLACHQQMSATDLVFQPFSNLPDPPPARVPVTLNRVEIFDYRWGPQALRVKAGATVVWVNYDSVPHDVKAADGSFESGNLPAQGRYFHVFDTPGPVDYFCAVHLEMRGQIVVEP